MTRAIDPFVNPNFGAEADNPLVTGVKEFYFKNTENFFDDCTIDGLLKTMDEIGVEHSVLTYYPEDPQEWILEFSRRHPDRFSLCAMIDVDRIEQLPFAVKRPQSDLLGEARRHYEQGNFAEAIIYYFSYQLVELDKHQVIRLTKGKTNRQYLGEARRAPDLRPLLEDTMVAFEDVFFGHHDLERSRFEACWNRLAQFQKSLAGGTT